MAHYFLYAKGPQDARFHALEVDDSGIYTADNLLNATRFSAERAEAVRAVVASCLPQHLVEARPVPQCV